MTVRTLYPIPGGAVGTGDYVTSTTLDESEIAAFREQTVRSGFWSLPAIAAPPPGVPVTLPDGSEVTLICADGTTVNIEGLEAGRYHVSRSGCDTFEEMGQLIASILQLANAKFSELRLPWIDEFVR
jgi:hypothetical protein